MHLAKIAGAAFAVMAYAAPAVNKGNSSSRAWERPHRVNLNPTNGTDAGLPPGCAARAKRLQKVEDATDKICTSAKGLGHVFLVLDAVCIITSGVSLIMHEKGCAKCLPTTAVNGTVTNEMKRRRKKECLFS